MPTATAIVFFVAVAVIIGLLILLFIQLRKPKKGETSLTEIHLGEKIEELRLLCKQQEHTIGDLNNKVLTLTSERDVNHSRAESLAENLSLKEAEHREAMAQAEKRHAERINEIMLRHDKTESDLRKSHDEYVKQLEEAHDKAQQEIKETHLRAEKKLEDWFKAQLAQLQQNIDKRLEQMRDLNREQVDSQLKLIREQMQTTSENVLKQRSKELDEQNKLQVSSIIDPLRKNIQDMEKAFNDNKLQQLDALSRLNATIELNTRDSQKLGETADRLARALTGEVKAQGNFGELKLKLLLENMQLREGEQYDTQETLRDSLGRRAQSEEGKYLIPDFILHFPNNRHVVIDAKMSLTAYERYMNLPEGDPEKAIELQNHISSVRNQVKRLASKSYTRYLPEGFNRLDFAFMYVPIDAALNLALLNDSTLWKEAYDQGVIILGPQTMYMNLRVLEMMWTQVRQLENQQAMIENANNIIDRVQDFATRFKDIDDSLRNTVGKFDNFKITIAPKGRSIITAAQNLIKAGGKENVKKISLAANRSDIFIEESTEKLLDVPPIETNDITDKTDKSPI